MEVAAAPTQAFGLTGIVVEPLERILVRVRSRAVTGSAWRLAIASDQGRGQIVLVDVSTEESYFRGDGVFLGWAQSALAEAYKVLTAPLADRDLEFELLQLG